MKRKAKPIWSPREIAKLLRKWGQIRKRQWRKHLPRRTWVAIRQKAQKLKLPFGPPQGYVEMSEAARRAGTSWELLHRILTESKVTMRRYLAPSGRSDKKRSPLIVEWEAARKAVEAWGRKETIGGAARARGLVASTLRRWLDNAGVLKPQEGRRRVQEVPSKVIDRIVAKNTPPATAERHYASVMEASIELGVNYTQLRRRLRRAGLLGHAIRGKATRIPAFAVDEIAKSCSRASHAENRPSVKAFQASK